MSIMSDLFKELWNTTHYYKGIPVNFFGIPRFKSYNKDSVYTALSRLRKKGFIEKESNGWILTPLGKKYAEKRMDSLQTFSFNFLKNAPKNLLVLFDIPETRKGEREWFRWHLKKANYMMIQKVSGLDRRHCQKNFSSMSVK